MGASSSVSTLIGLPPRTGTLIYRNLLLSYSLYLLGVNLGPKNFLNPARPSLDDLDLISNGD